MEALLFPLQMWGAISNENYLVVRLRKTMCWTPTRGQHGSDKLQQSLSFRAAGYHSGGFFHQPKYTYLDLCRCDLQLRQRFPHYPFYTGLFYRETPRVHEMEKLGRNKKRDFKIRIVIIASGEKVECFENLYKTLFYFYCLPRTVFIKGCGCQNSSKGMLC